MTTNSAPIALRIQCSSDLQARVESIVCDQCQGLCWTAEVWLHGIGGSSAKACVLHRDHLELQSTALFALGGLMMGAAREIASAEARAWELEHQGQLW